LILPLTTRRAVASVDFGIDEEIVIRRGELVHAPTGGPTWFIASAFLQIRSSGDCTDSDTE
jgi:hypothetical protein